MFIARVLDSEGVTWWEGAIPDRMPYFRMAAMNQNWMTKMWDSPDAEMIPVKEIDAYLERELPPEDGGPLLIYRIGAKDVLVDL